jgi:hypothetical protein
VPPSNNANAAHVSHVSGMFNTGNSVFNAQMPRIGPSAIAITINVIPKINLISADVIAKIPPKDKPTSNLLLLCLQSKHSNLDL